MGSGHFCPAAAGLASATAVSWVRGERGGQHRPGRGGSHAVASPLRRALVRGEGGYRWVLLGLRLPPRVAARRGEGPVPQRVSSRGAPSALPQTLRGKAPRGAGAGLARGRAVGGLSPPARRGPSATDLFLPCRGRRRDGERRCGCEQSFRDCCLNWAVTFRETAGSFWWSASSYLGRSL